MAIDQSLLRLAGGGGGGGKGKRGANLDVKLCFDFCTLKLCKIFQNPN